MILFQPSSVFLLAFAFAAFLFLPGRWRWGFLLALSAVFLYAQDPLALALAAAQTALSYAMCLWLEKHRRLSWLWTFLFIQLAPLLLMRWEANPIATAGIAFYTLQILAAMIEVYWGRRAAERNFGRYALYVLLFVNKLAGPVERPAFLDQLPEIVCPDPAALMRSALFIWLGFFQKFVIANHIGAYVDPVFRAPAEYAGLPVTVTVLLSKYQIYCSLSGFSLIALGLGGLFGMRLTPNFNRPFAALTLAEYWRRWMISVQTWFRDYVFFPLLSSPLARFGLAPPLFATFVLFGLWWDLRWTLAAYGVVQGLLIWAAPEKLLLRSSVPRSAIWVFNYIVLISLPGVLFRSGTFANAWAAWSNMGWSMTNWRYFVSLDQMSFFTLLILIAGHEIFLWSDSRRELFSRLAGKRWFIRLGAALPMLIVLLFFAKSGE